MLCLAVWQVAAMQRQVLLLLRRMVGQQGRLYTMRTASGGCFNTCTPLRAAYCCQLLSLQGMLC